ncbi:nicotinate (nicotinamide) nucleotide adenylyltransferase [Merdibacter massiliensis]|uniref:nicotinate (nicotinamide) nucleotide adenylyltransferase n=1 Tax=Merdibacter massiliensis TaxID=1871030 RepID=UPI00096A6760|nr:nicotinate (nicotinamide) nucleotide adenylyltransferase [Merdibacter massiliensis]
MRKKKIAILGGSFDPIHAGHMQIAKEALHMGMDEVWLMVAKDTPLKDRKLTPASHRAAMVKRAIAPYRHIRCCELELHREGKSYTIDTVRALQANYPDFHFYWLIGSDQAAQLADWKDAEELTRRVTMIVFSRKGNPLESVYPLCYHKMKLVDVSSSEIRQGKKWYALHRGVRSYIAQHGLYLESVVAAHLSEKRYAHCVRVAELSVELALASGNDPKIAYQIGLLHDICKEFGKEGLSVWMHQFFPSLCEESPAVWHGYVGSILAKRWYGVNDRRILHAIYHHVKGESTAPYAMIIFCADKLERGRGYDTSEQIALCKRDLYQGFLRVKHEQQTYLKKEK